MQKLLVVDGNSILNRAYYAIRPMATQAGIYTNAVLGTVNILSRHLEAIKPEFAAIAFDLKAPTFRHTMYAGYKASRKGMPDELAMQLPYVKRIAAMMGFSVLSLEGYEADDILGTLSAMGAGSGAHSYLVTGDRDSLQLVDENVTVLLATNAEDVVYDPVSVLGKYSLTPDQLVDLKALMGDSSDEIPGVKGVGEKTAIALMVQAGSLDNLYVMLDGGTLEASPSVKNKLTDGRESAYMSRDLARIIRDVPLQIGLDDVRMTPRDDAGLLEVFAELELRSLIKKFGFNADTAVSAPVKAVNDSGQINFGDAEDVSAAPKEDISEFDVSLLNINSIVYATYNAKSAEVYLCQSGTVFRADISACGEVFGGKYDVCTDDAKRLYGALMRGGIACDTNKCVFDTSLAGYVLSPTDGDYTIEKLALRYLSRSVFERADNNITLLCELLTALSDRLRSNGQEHLFGAVELPLAFVLLSMEQMGFLVDRKGIEEYAIILAEKINALQEQIYTLAQVNFNINSPKQLGEVLFEKLKLPHGRKTKTGYSTDADVLDTLAAEHEIVRNILEFRALSKLKSTYCDGLMKTISPADGRIHTSFNQTITATGRLSSTEPNLQNIPVRTEAGQQLRKYFVPEQGYTLLDADYSQIELRLLAHISQDAELIRAFNNNEDIHTLTASEVFGIPMSEVTPLQRKRAKAVNFGIVYGIGEASLAQDIGVTRKEAGEYIAGYFRKYPGVKKYMEEIVKSAREKGYVETFMGRRRYIPELVSAKSQLVSFGERVARNTPIQGGAADIIKVAMINVHKRLRDENLKSRLILQVHDELIIEAAEGEADYVAQLLKQEMENTCTLSVKMTADVGAGISWLDAKE